MNEITLEKVDQIVTRTGVSYERAKEVLMEANGDVLEGIIILEKASEAGFQNSVDEEYVNVETTGCKMNFVTGCSVEEFKAWLKEVIEKGNVSRIKIKKEDTVIADLPVNAGISAMVIAVVLPAFLAFGVIAAVATKVTIEITKADGSVEVVNKYVKKVTDDVLEKASTAFSGVKEIANQKAGNVKEKISDVKNDMKNKSENKSKVYGGDDTVYTYTVKFDEE
ncbi:DUF4342 domain-containing protein [uncultured Clostridium sp.]|uniref:DUF4342 domain-containing protein n=1 Tax=uncultured Clostridium sp. TaxID=59620 RepID=UPI002612C42E|nr:DUF4342 domain-containing protein [uncultured Clostridium sp.]